MRLHRRLISNSTTSRLASSSTSSPTTQSKKRSKTNNSAPNRNHHYYSASGMIKSAVSSPMTPGSSSSSSSKKHYLRCYEDDDDDGEVIELTATSVDIATTTTLNGTFVEGTRSTSIPISQSDDDDDNDNDDELFFNTRGSAATRSSTAAAFVHRKMQTVMEEVVTSAEILFSSKIIYLLVFAPMALVGDAYKLIAPPLCFVFAAVALIPCAERLSFVTEQVAEHTNGTFGALLNATFGNAPELLISYAALHSGYYRVVQLTLLGSILTNLLLVFGVSCVVGGYKHSVQELRMTSGNVSIGMLFIATAGLLLPAALKLSNQEAFTSTTTTTTTTTSDNNSSVVTYTELQYSRINSLFMIIMYVGYLFFQLHTHKEEFEDSPPPPPPPLSTAASTPTKTTPRRLRNTDIAKYRTSAAATNSDEELLVQESPLFGPQCPMTPNRRHTMKEVSPNEQQDHEQFSSHFANNVLINGNDPTVDDYCGKTPTVTATFDIHNSNNNNNHPPLMSFWAGILWLLIITLCISAMSDIIVDTIHSFAVKVHLSEVFTALVVVPFFSNIAEQTSSILFAYRNEMDLCVGITVGSAIQISLFVLPGSVLMGWMIGRSMSLFFHGFETVSLLMGVLTVTAVLQGGTSNWLTGLFCIGVYGMIAVGFWFHQVEDLSHDEEILLRNETLMLLLR